MLGSLKVQEAQSSRCGHALLMSVHTHAPAVVPDMSPKDLSREELAARLGNECFAGFVLGFRHVATEADLTCLKLMFDSTTQVTGNLLKAPFHWTALDVLGCVCVCLCVCVCMCVVVVSWRAAAARWHFRRCPAEGSSWGTRQFAFSQMHLD